MRLFLSTLAIGALSLALPALVSPGAHAAEPIYGAPIVQADWYGHHHHWHHYWHHEYRDGYYRHWHHHWHHVPPGYGYRYSY